MQEKEMGTCKVKFEHLQGLLLGFKVTRVKESTLLQAVIVFEVRVYVPSLNGFCGCACG